MRDDIPGLDSGLVGGFALSDFSNDNPADVGASADLFGKFAS
jgi:hypothetical protein